MLKEIKLHNNFINEKIKENNSKTDWQALERFHLNKIQFFQHERQIHLMVTLSFGLYTLMTCLVTLIFNNIYLFAVVILFLLLLIPYVFYYMLIENSVQALYKQYEKIIEHNLEKD